MARFGWYLALTAMTGALSAMVSFGLGLDADTRVVVLSGIGAATVAGALSLAARFAIGGASIAVALATQGMTFMLKLAAVVLGTFAWHNHDQSPIPFLLAFLAVYAVLQVIEVRHGLTPGPELKLRTSEETKS